jgi:hypothetical protein
VFNLLTAAAAASVVKHPKNEDGEKTALKTFTAK